jgi:hypothetical protein
LLTPASGRAALVRSVEGSMIATEMTAAGSVVNERELSGEELDAASGGVIQIAEMDIVAAPHSNTGNRAIDTFLNAFYAAGGRF